VLLSSGTRTGLKVNLPLVGDINEIIGQRGLPFQVKFSQKINLLGERLAVAWCGSALQAERVLRRLAIIASCNDATSADIEAELDAINCDHAINEVQLVGLLVRDVHGTTVEATRFSWGINGVEVPRLGPVHAAGSGREAFLALLNKADFTNSGTGSEFQVAHALLGALTNEEYRTGAKILNRWGGGFEAVTYSREARRLQKVGDILHTFWRIEKESAGRVEFFPMFYKTSYWNDALIIRSASFDRIASGGYTPRTNDLDLVPPFLTDSEAYDLSELGSVDFSYRAIC
jgi:hypothetical protein